MTRSIWGKGRCMLPKGAWRLAAYTGCIHTCSVASSGGMRRENSNFNAQTTTQDAVKWFMHTSFWYEMFPWRSHCSIWEKSPNSTNLLKFLFAANNSVALSIFSNDVNVFISGFCSVKWSPRSSRNVLTPPFQSVIVRQRLLRRCMYHESMDDWLINNGIPQTLITSYWGGQSVVMAFNGPYKAWEGVYAASLGCSC